MKILSVHARGTILGGAEIVCVHGNRLLTERAHSIAWLTMGDAPYAAKSGQVAYCLPETRDGNQLQKQISLAVGHLYNHQVRKLAEHAILEFRPDVVHIHNIQGHLSPSVLLPFNKHSIPVIQTLHDYRLLCPAIHFLSRGQVCELCKGGRYYSCVLRRCRKGGLLRSGVAALGSYISDHYYRYDKLISAYIAPSEFMRQKMLEFGYAGGKIQVLPNAYFGQTLDPGRARREHILFAGRLSSEKGADLLVRAAKNLDAKVIVAGDGPERGNLQALAQRLGANNLRFPGFLHANELERLYQTALVTVLPSRWYENCPLTLLESYANSTPVVGARIGAIPELIEDGKTGFLFTPNDADDLNKVLQYCITRAPLLRRMGITALSKVRAKYSPHAYLEGLESVLNNVANKNIHKDDRS